MNITMTEIILITKHVQNFYYKTFADVTKQKTLYLKTSKLTSLVLWTKSWIEIDQIEKSLPNWLKCHKSYLTKMSSRALKAKNNRVFRLLASSKLKHHQFYIYLGNRANFYLNLPYASKLFHNFFCGFWEIFGHVWYPRIS